MCHNLLIVASWQAHFVVFATSSTDPRQLVYVNALRPGAFFGVNALQPGPAKVRAATIMTAETSSVLKLQRSEFDEFLAKHPQRRKGLLDTIGQKMEDHLKVCI